jgi:hypothetical protein
LSCPEMCKQISGQDTLKEIGDYFQLHYSRVSKIVSKRKA